MALELVYWAEGVRRPSPQTPLGQGRVAAVFRDSVVACAVPSVGLCWQFGVSRLTPNLSQHALRTLPLRRHVFVGCVCVCVCVVCQPPRLHAPARAWEPHSSLFGGLTSDRKKGEMPGSEPPWTRPRGYRTPQPPKTLRVPEG